MGVPLAAYSIWLVEATEAEEIGSTATTKAKMVEMMAPCLMAGPV